MKKKESNQDLKDDVYDLREALKTILYIIHMEDGSLDRISMEAQRVLANTRTNQRLFLCNNLDCSKV